MEYEDAAHDDIAQQQEEPDSCCRQSIACDGVKWISLALLSTSAVLLESITLRAREVVRLAVRSAVRLAVKVELKN